MLCTINMAEWGGITVRCARAPRYRTRAMTASDHSVRVCVVRVSVRALVIPIPASLLLIVDTMPAVRAPLIEDVAVACRTLVAAAIDHSVAAAVAAVDIVADVVVPVCGVYVRAIDDHHALTSLTLLITCANSCGLDLTSLSSFCRSSSVRHIFS